MPFPMQKAKSNMVHIVSESVIKKLKPHIPDKDQRIDIALDICDEIMSFLDNKTKFKKTDG